MAKKKVRKNKKKRVLARNKRILEAQNRQKNDFKLASVKVLTQTMLSGSKYKGKNE